MSAVLLDPDQMDATANAISAHAAEVDATARELDDVGAVEVPMSVAGWLAGEIADIALTVRMAALVYLLAAMDTITRAESIRTNQSLVTAIPVVGATTPSFTESGFALGLGGTTSYVAPSGVAAGFALGGASSSYVPPAPGAIGFTLDVDPVLDPSANGYVLNNVPRHLSVTNGTYSGGPPASPGDQSVTENIMTARLQRLDRITWVQHNYSMTRFTWR